MKTFIMKGTDLVSLAFTHIGEPYILGSLVPKAVPKYRGPFDCAEFTSYIVYQVTGKLYGCANNNGNPNSADSYTGFWGRDAKTLGKIISIEEAIRTPGACLLRLAANGLTGHIVFSQGNGKTIEANSKAYGVMENVVNGRRWDVGVLVPWVDYSVAINTPVIVPASENIYRFTNPMMKGEGVAAIQRALSMRPKEIDGIYGMATFTAVRNFQYKHGLVPDGEAGPKTFAAMGLKGYF